MSGSATFRFTHDAMACMFGLELAMDDERWARHAARAACDELDRLEQLLSRFIPHSDIARINRLAVGTALRVAPETVECLQLAAALHAETGGAFDVAYRSRPKETHISPLVFDPQVHAVGVQVAGVELDMGGLGKGYALDRIAALLREWGVTAACLHAGQSTVYALGRPAGTQGWHVALRDPDEAERTSATLTLADQALAGSGQRLHGAHIVAPRTGQPVAAGRAAWAVAPSAARADGLSTAFMVMTEAEIAAYCARHADVAGLVRSAPGVGLQRLGEGLDWGGLTLES